MVDEADRFHLKWEDFPAKITLKLSKYKEKEVFCDVTIACEDEKEIKAHKVVLSASSPFFERILKRSDHTHPWLYLAGVKSKEMESILQFIYRGETQVAEHDMVRFLKKANQMEIQGLTGWNGEARVGGSKKEKKSVNFSENVQDVESSFPEPIQEDADGAPVLAPECSINETDQEIDVDAPVHIIKDEPAEKADKGTDENMVVELEGYPQEAEEYEENEIENRQPRHSFGGFADDDVVKADGVFMCRRCGKTAKTKQNIRKHVEIHLQGQSYPCNFCEKCYKTNNSLNFHISKAHRSKFQ